MTFAADEESVEDSSPREGFEIQTPAATYRVATGVTDVTINGNLYHASPAARGELGVSFVGSPGELILKLPVSHALAARYLAGGVPPTRITVTGWRLQQRSGEVERFWVGRITSCAVDGHIASFRVPASSGETTQRRLPTVTVQRQCPHILYDPDCRVPRASFVVATTVASHDGRSVTIASIGGNPDYWAQFGELVHIPSGERMTIITQIGTLITMQLPISELASGDAVQVYAGCDHTIETCGRGKFSNQHNFGGLPALPTGNVFVPNGLGVYETA